MNHLSATTNFLDKGSQLFNVKAYGAKGDGSTNDSALFQAAHDTVTSGGTIYVPDGVYILNSRWNISKSNLHIILAPGAVLKPGAANISTATGQPGLLHIYNSAGAQSNVTVRGGTIDLNNMAEVNAISIWEEVQTLQWSGQPTYG